MSSAPLQSVRIETWMDKENRLGEPRPTQVDAMAEGAHSVILFECKFTEAAGGACSQVEPRKVPGQEAHSPNATGRMRCRPTP
jgi:hypothetical protein